MHRIRRVHRLEQLVEALFWIVQRVWYVQAKALHPDVPDRDKSCLDALSASCEVSQTWRNKLVAGQIGKVADLERNSSIARD